MKNIHQFRLGLALAALLLGCSTLCSCTLDETDQSIPAPASESHLVPVESAIAALRQFGGGKTQTRSGNLEIALVESVPRSIVARNLSQDTPLAYVVNFEGGGYAILGADDRQPAVVAYVPQGTMTVRELIAAQASSDSSQEGLAAVRLNAKLLDYLEKIMTGEIASENRFAAVPDTRPRFEALEWTLMQSQWDQGDPYNASCDPVIGVTPPAGSAAIALGQILIYNIERHNMGPQTIKKPFQISNTPGFTPNWSLLYQTITSKTLTFHPEVRQELADFIHAIGTSIFTQYGQTKSTAETADIQRFLSMVCNYRWVALRTPTFDDLKKMVHENKLPVIAMDYTSGNKYVWVIDGYKEIDILYPVESGGYINIPDKYFYYRYGMGGEYDGWYIYPVKDTLPHYIQYIMYYDTTF